MTLIYWRSYWTVATQSAQRESAWHWWICSDGRWICNSCCRQPSRGSMLQSRSSVQYRCYTVRCRHNGYDQACRPYVFLKCFAVRTFFWNLVSATARKVLFTAVQWLNIQETVKTTCIIMKLSAYIGVQWFFVRPFLLSFSNRMQYLVKSEGLRQETVLYSYTQDQCIPMLLYGLEVCSNSATSKQCLYSLFYIQLYSPSHGSKENIVN